MKTAIIGGGAAGFFLAVNLKEMMPSMQVTIFEASNRVLTKVAISGGGRCNCTNTFASVRDLSAVYPRGHRLMKRLFHEFSPRDAYQWFERHGVRLTTQPDECVFPATQSSHTIVDCLLREARRHGVELLTGERITTLQQLTDYDYVAVTVGGQPRAASLQWLQALGHEIAAPVPSLFSLRIDDPQLHTLMGTVADGVTTLLPGTRHRADGPLLVTHWGMSGPAILRLSSYAARHLADHHYSVPLAVNWTGRSESEVQQQLADIAVGNAHRQLTTVRPFDLPSRLWTHLLERSLGSGAHSPWSSLNRKQLNRLASTLTCDVYPVSGRAPFKDEFVTCGGVALTSVHPSTLQSRSVARLYFAGEVLDVDGITGGFNFQAAWTTAYTVAQAIATAAAAAK